MKKVQKMIAAFMAVGLMATQPLAISAQAVTVAEMPVFEPNFMPLIETFLAGGADVEAQDNGDVYVSFFGATVVLTPEQILATVDGMPFELIHGVVVIEEMLWVSDIDLQVIQQHVLMAVSRVFELSEEARDIALEDFDYLVDLILDNSAWDQVVYALHGVSLVEHAAAHREFIENMVPVQFPVIEDFLFPYATGGTPVEQAANYLSHFLFHSFAMGLGQIGHMAPRDIATYRMILTSVVREIHHAEDPQMAEFIESMWAAYIDPAAIRFYGEYEVDLYSEEHPMPVIPGNVVTEHIEEGRVAYLRINSFLSNPDYDDEIILPFLQSVADYEHLIIDIRGNVGGLLAYFTPLVVSRLLTEDVNIISAEFFSGGAEAAGHMALLYELVQWSQLAENAVGVEDTHVSIVSASEFLAGYELPYLNPTIFENLDYAMLMEGYVRMAEDNVGFTGKVWLLVDQMSMSASVLAAQTVMATGLGTVVGEPTSQIMGVNHLYRALPNTGIIWRMDVGFLIDAYGRSLEVYGLMPDVLNMEGKSGLETVLYLINQ